MATPPVGTGMERSNSGEMTPVLTASDTASTDASGPICEPAGSRPPTGVSREGEPADERRSSILDLPDDIVRRVLESVLETERSTRPPLWLECPSPSSNRTAFFSSYLSAALLSRNWLKTAWASLRSAVVQYQRAVPEQVFLQELGQYPSLTELDISSVESLSPAFLRAAATRWPHLEALAIRGIPLTPDFAEADESLLRAGLGSLKSLELEKDVEALDSWGVDDEQFTTVPRWVLSLSQLDRLSLDMEVLGEDFCTTFSSLRQLRLKGNPFDSGGWEPWSVPRNFASMTALQVLELCGSASGNKAVSPGFTTDEVVPEVIGDLHSLRHLEISDCFPVSRLPESISRLSGLTCLKVVACPGISYLPQDFGAGLVSLEVCILVGVSLLFIPEKVSSLESLRTLCVKSNYLEDLPSSMKLLTSLKSLTISKWGPALNRDIWASFCLLRVLELECEALSCVPESIEVLSSLKRLVISQWDPDPEDLWWGYCDGDLPPERRECLPCGIGNLKKLQHLEVRGQWDLAAFPESFSDLASLKKLILHCGQLHSLPSSIAMLKQLQHLDVRVTGMLQELPEAVSCMEGLTTLRLEGCTPTGVTPSPQLAL